MRNILKTRRQKKFENRGAKDNNSKKKNERKLEQQS